MQLERDNFEIEMTRRLQLDLAAFVKLHHINVSSLLQFLINALECSVSASREEAPDGKTGLPSAYLFCYGMVYARDVTNGYSTKLNYSLDDQSN